MQVLSEEERCEISVGMLRERLVHAGKLVSQLSARVLTPAVRRLARHSLVQVTRGFEGRDDEPVVVMPLVEKVLPSDRIQEIEQRVKDYVGSRAAATSADVTDDAELNAVEDNAEREDA